MQKNILESDKNGDKPHTRVQEESESEEEDGEAGKKGTWVEENPRKRKIIVGSESDEDEANPYEDKPHRVQEPHREEPHRVSADSPIMISDSEDDVEIISEGR